MIEILLVVITMLLIFLIYLVQTKKGVDEKGIETAIASSWSQMRLDEKIGAIEIHAQEMKASHKNIENMLRTPIERAALGELSLETIFSDQLPHDMYGIRKKILEGKVPDAHIISTVGHICIDSKFPLDNFSKMVNTEDLAEKESFKKQFIKDVKGHLEKIAGDYVCPEKGSAEFAFAYIPSESVYYFLVNEAYDMLREYTKKGVQVVSPLTLSHKIELIKAGVHSKKLSENAQQIRNDLLRISQRFNEVDEIWRILYERHFRNTTQQADKLDSAYSKLRDEFDRVSRMSEEE